MTAQHPSVPRSRPASKKSERRPLDAEELASLRERFGAVLHELLVLNPGADTRLPEQAFDVAIRSHFDQRRRSGEPYLIHPTRVALTIARMGLGPVSIAAGILHDAVEDSEITVFELAETFGRDVAQIVDGVTKLGKVPYLSRQENQAESFRKMLVAMSRDIRVLLVKLADRLDNMQTLEHMPPLSQQRIARETMDIFVPLAGRLGVDWLRRELRDLAFRYLEPVRYAEILASKDALLSADPDFVDRTLERLHQAFTNDPEPSRAVAEHGPLRMGDESDHAPRWREGIFGPVELRASMRPIYAMHHRSLDTGRELDQVADVVTYQVVTQTHEGCYAALGQVHSAFKPAPGRFRDYIALPRPNRYRALHTVVTDRGGVRMEVQIRSEAMDTTAERGIVVDLRRGSEGEASKLQWLSSLVDWQNEVLDPHEFIAAVKADLFADEVYAFTPEGDLKTFPRGATPIDFAFSIHTDVGMHTSGARVNGEVVALRYLLRQGDTVEILTDPTVWPQAGWLEMCAGSRARAKVKHYIRQLERDRLEAAGRALVEQLVRQEGAALTDFEANGRLSEQIEALGTPKERGVGGVYEAIADGQIETEAVVRLLIPKEESAARSGSLFSRMLRHVPGIGRGELRSTAQGSASAPIILTRDRVTGPKGTVQLAACCSPLPGDPLIGFLVRGRGISAHVEGCSETLAQIEQRRVFLAWEEGLELERPVTLKVRTWNKVGLLAEMSRAFSAHGVNIKEANCRTDEEGRNLAVNTFNATVRSLDELESLCLRLREIRGVIGVERVFFEGRE